MIMREIEKRTGTPGGFIESDLVDPRYFGKANIKNRAGELLADAQKARFATGGNA
jgi:benzoyl-CoA reductase subunit B